MTVLSAIQGASVGLGLAAPSAVFAATDRTAVEMAEIAREAAQAIAEAHDWQVLKRLQTYTGTGAADAFDLPADFLRMPKDQRIWSSAQETPMTHVLSHDDWLELEVKTYELVTRAWTILGGQVAIKPTMPTGETAKFYYQSSHFARDGAGTKADFTADGDEFRLPERVLKLGIVWRWRALKGLDYSEEMVNFEIALSKAIAADKGPRTLAMGRGRWPKGVTIAYPQAVRP